MDKRNFALAMTLLIAGSIMSCKKDDPPPVVNYAELNGTWTGTSSVIKTGTCDWTDPSTTFSQLWSVDQTGKAFVTEEYFKNGISYTVIWEGIVDASYNVSISHEQDISCSGTPSVKTITLIGKITKTGSVFKLVASADFDVCPPNCLFDLNYIAVKQ